MADDQKTLPRATYTLLVATFLVLVWQIFASMEVKQGLVLSQENFWETGYVLITYGFLHSGPSHFTGNMVSLFVQGKILERSIGSLKMPAVYLAGITGGGLAWLAFNPASTVVGASAATSAVMGANMAISPGRSLVDEIPVLRRFPLPGLRSLLNVSLWAAVAILVNLQMTFEGAGSTATLAHLGGIVSGVAAVFFLSNKATRKGLLTTAGFAATLSGIYLVNPESVLWKIAVLGILLLTVLVRRTRKRSV